MKTTSLRTGRKAFALILAIAAMAFMVLLVLTLSSVITSKLRLLTAQKEQRLARSNALLGLGVAMSQLQRTMGPDNAVSFSAAIFDQDVKTPQIEGVMSPYVFGGYKVPIENSASTFKALHKDRSELFDPMKSGLSANEPGINWFISSERTLNNPVSDDVRLFSAETIKLAEYKTLTQYPGDSGGPVTSDMKSDTQEVYAGKIKIDNGYYAWWVSDESVKAKLNLHRPETYLNGLSTGDAALFEAPADRRIPQISYIRFVDALGSNELNPFLGGYNNELPRSLSKMTSMDEFAIIDETLGTWAKENKGDYTMNSFGIPVDVTQGRLKEDLTVYIESGNGANDADPIVRGHSNDKDYIGPSFGIKNYDKNLPRMGFLKDYATMARQSGSGSKPTFDSTAPVAPRKESYMGSSSHGLYPILHTLKYTFQPVFANGSPGGDVDIYLMFYPRIFLWNPHNVRLEKSDYAIRLYLPYFLELGARSEQLGVHSKNKNGGPNGDVGAALAVWPATCFVEFPAGTAEQKKQGIWYHPQMVYVDNSHPQFKTVRRNFSTFLRKSLRRGQSPIASGQSELPGYPVVTMLIEGLALNPGESIELTPKGEANNVYPNESSRSKDSGVLEHASYPHLTGGTFVLSGERLEAEAGICLDPKIKLTPLHPTSVRGDDTAGRYAANEGAPNGMIIANWRVAPVLEKEYEGNNVMTHAPQESEGSFPSPGYELWLKKGSNYEMLVSLDMGKVEKGGEKSVIDENIGYNNTSGVARHAATLSAPYDKEFISSYGQHEIFPAMYGTRFSTSYAWDNALPTSSDGSYYEKFTNQRYHYTIKNVSGESGTLLDSTWFDLSTEKKDGITCYVVNSQVSRPQIPEHKDFIGTEWALSGNHMPQIYYVEKASGDISTGFQDPGLTANRTNTKYGYKVWGDLKKSQKTLLEIHPHKNAANWSICTIVPPKNGAGSGFTTTGQVQNPVMFVASNFLRDNGSASRVNANHGYIGMVREADWGGGYGNIKSQIFNINHTNTNVGLIDRKFPNSNSYQGFGYLSNYSTANDEHHDRYGAAVLWGTAVSWMQNNDMGLVQTVFDYPRFKEDILSLGIFHQANLSMMFWQPTFPFGESYASGFIDRDEIANEEGEILHDNELIDISFMLNASMWDRFYLSTMPQDGSAKPFAGMRLMNPRHVVSSVPQSEGDLYGDDKAYKESAAHILVEGAFNVNSTSYEAWRAFLSGMLGTKKQSILEGEYPQDINQDSPSEFYMPNPGNINVLIHPQASNKPYGYRDAGAGRNISEADIDELVREIIAEVKRRAPFFSLSDFINRRLVSYEESIRDDSKEYQGLMGTIAAAIHRLQEEYDSSTANPFNMYSQKIKVTDQKNVRHSVYKAKNEYIEHAKQGPMSDTFVHLRGMPGVLKQSQILNAIAPFITVRGDTYTIRAFGEYKNEMTGNHARAYCEAVVQRGADPVDPSDDIVAPKGQFGRKFKVVSFRWLSPAEL